MSDRKNNFDFSRQSWPKQPSAERVVGERGRKELPPGTKGGENMKPDRHAEHKQHAFDSFCKKVLRNEARDYQDALARKRNREVYFSELPVEALEQFAVRDTYFTDSRTFEVIGHSVCIDDETLAEAISALPVDRRDIILLSYFLDMSDAEIANVLNMVRRSVAYRRTSTLKLLKNLMGGENR